MTRHIGIVACSAEGAALCYRTICTEAPALMGVAHAHPEVSMHTPSLADYTACLEADDWDGVGQLMLGSAEKLAAIGADVLICPDNTIHQALPAIRDRSPRPWLHIAETVAAEAKAQGFARIGITGTRWLVESGVYPKAFDEQGLDYARPAPDEREACDRYIMEELVNGIFSDDAIACFRATIARLGEAGCDAVVLGCTEIPLIIDAGNSPLPPLDSTRLLARAALREALA